jgi:predicted fused transcriptional regulator/phosphomethylpyrimidine kinase
MELEDAAEAMYEGIRARDTHVSFPWQLASIVKAARALPDAIYDRALKGKTAKKG